MRLVEGERSSLGVDRPLGSVSRFFSPAMPVSSKLCQTQFETLCADAYLNPELNQIMIKAALDIDSGREAQSLSWTYYWILYMVDHPEVILVVSCNRVRKIDKKRLWRLWVGSRSIDHQHMERYGGFHQGRIPEMNGTYILFKWMT